MKDKTSALHSEYIIDGVLMDVRPADMLSQSSDPKEGGYAPIVDESLDPPLMDEDYEAGKLAEYLALTSEGSGKPRFIDPAYSAFHTRLIIAASIIDTLWREGHFGLADLSVDLRWNWDSAPVGNMSAFYRSVEAACEYLDGLGVRIAAYSFEEAAGCMLTVNISLDAKADEDFGEYEERVSAGVPEEFDDPALHKTMGSCRRCGSAASAPPSDWIIYVPFDTCDSRLGGSLLAGLLGRGGAAPDISDPDYFIDCYELLREMVEDGVVKAGFTMGLGGMMTGLKAFLPPGTGMDVDLAGIMRGQEKGNVTSVLFSELPGVLIGISDSDYDYIDAEFLLQDVAYFPLGHPHKGKEGLRIVTADSLSGILRALLGGQVSEGED